MGRQAMAPSHASLKHMLAEGSQVAPHWSPAPATGAPLQGKNGGKMRKAGGGRPKVKYGGSGSPSHDAVADFGLMAAADARHLQKLRNADILNSQWGSVGAGVAEAMVPMRRAEWNMPLGGRETWGQQAALEPYDFDGLGAPLTQSNPNLAARHGRGHLPVESNMHLWDEAEAEEFYGRRLPPPQSSAMGHLRFDRFEGDGMERSRVATGRRGEGRMWREGETAWEGALGKEMSAGFLMSLKEEEQLQLRRRAQQLLRQQEVAQQQQQQQQQQQSLRPSRSLQALQQAQEQQVYVQQEQSVQQLAMLLEQQRLIMQALAFEESEARRGSPDRHVKGGRPGMEFDDHLLFDAESLSAGEYGMEQGKGAPYEVQNGRPVAEGYQSHSPRSVQDFPEAMLDATRRSPSPPQGVYERGLWRPLEQQVVKHRGEKVHSPIATEWKGKAKQSLPPMHRGSARCLEATEEVALPSQDEMDSFLSSVQFVR